MGIPARRINYNAGFDIYDPQTWVRLQDLRRRHRPKRIWFSFPCTKWCQFTNLNYNTPERREVLETARRRERKMLKNAKQFILQALDEDPDFDIYWEWTHPCAGWEQQPVVDLREGLRARGLDWLPCRVDGCRYGMTNKAGTELLKKRWLIRTTDERFHQTFRARVCTNNHNHARIEGAETSRSSYYPLRLVQAIVRGWLSELAPQRYLKYLSACQNLSDKDVTLDDDHWNFKHYQHNGITSMDPTRPSHASLSPSREHWEATQSLALPPGHVHDDLHTGELHADGHPASEAILSVPSDVPQDGPEHRAWSAKLHHFHKAAGHPTNRNLVHLLRDARLPEWKVQMARDFKCASCDALRPGGSSSGSIPPASTHPLYRAWQAIGVDVTEWVIPNSKLKLKFMLIMDLATRLRAVHVIKCYDVLKMQSESSADIIKGLAERWLADKPRPEVVIPDNGITLVSRDVSDFLSDIGVQLAPPAEKESWAHGQVESAIKDVKMTASAIQLGSPSQDPIITLHLAIAALNSTEYVKGYSSFQWCYGKDYSITDEDVRTFATLPESPDDDYARLVQLRQSAEQVARKTRALRVLSKLSNSTVRQPIRTFHPMQLVMVWRKQWPSHVYVGKRGGARKSGRPHWIGPGRVVFHEILPHQQPSDARRHIVWVLLQNQLLRCSVHSVRPTTPLEETQFEISAKEDVSRWRSLSDMLPNKEFIDLADDEPGVDEQEQPDLPDLPNKETIDIPKRRIRVKSAPFLVPPRPVHVPFMADDPDYTPESLDSSMGPSMPETSTEPQALPPDLPGTSSPSADPAAEDPNSYEPENKKQRTDGYDLGWLEELHQVEGDLHQLLIDSQEVMKIEFDVDLNSHRKEKDLLRDASAFMVKKMRDSEVVLSRLSPEHRELFSRAKSKEVSSFIKSEAVRKALDNKEVSEAFDSGRIMRARWVLTWKPTPPEDLQEAQAEAKSNAKSTYTKDGQRKAKARIVLLGYEHPDLLRPEFKTSSPVQSGLGRNLLYTMACTHGWELEGLDLATAFLQTQPTEADQDLWTRGVSELREALDVPADGVMKILKNIYGSTTAPRGLWLDLHRRLASIGGKPLIGERCIWIWQSATEKDAFGIPLVLGIMGGHVDDFHRCGNRLSPEWVQVCSQIDKLYEWGTAKRGNYRHAGTDLTSIINKDGSVEVKINQQYYIDSIADVSIDPDRLRQENAVMNPEEVAACRTTWGSLQWLALQTQPQLCARCNLLASEITTKRLMQSALELQQLVGEIRKHAYQLHYKKPPGVESWRDMVFVTFCDQAHANRSKMDSTGGLISVATGPHASEGKVTYMAPLAWRSWKLRRKAISSNDAEVQAILDGEDQNFRIRVLWCEMNGAGHDLTPHEDRVEWAERMARGIKGILATDSKGGYDAVIYNESPMLGLSNARAALQALQLREHLTRTGAELRWVASDYDLGDALTKKKAECRLGLTKFLQTGLWSVAYDNTFTSARKSHGQGRSAIKDVTAHQQRDQQLRKVFGPCDSFGCDMSTVDPLLPPWP